MVRRGKTGLREYRRSLLHPFVVRERELKARSNLQPGEAEEFHSLHRLFTDASALGSRIWDFTTSRTLAEHLHVSGRIIDSVCGTSASPRSPDHSPVQEEEEFPSWTQPVTPEASVHSVCSSPDRSRSPVRTVLNPSETVRTATIAPDVRDLRVAVLLDHHGVLDKSFRTSTELIRRLRGEFGSEVYICCLSYAPSDHRIAEVTSHSRRLGIDSECTRIKFGNRGKKGWARWILEREGISCAFFVDDQQALVDEVKSLGPHIEACVLPQWDSILTVHSRIRQFVSESLDWLRFKQTNPER